MTNKKIISLFSYEHFAKRFIIFYSHFCIYIYIVNYRVEQEIQRLLDKHSNLVQIYSFELRIHVSIVTRSLFSTQISILLRIFCCTRRILSIVDIIMLPFLIPKKKNSFLPRKRRGTANRTRLMS